MLYQARSLKIKLILAGIILLCPLFIHAQEKYWEKIDNGVPKNVRNIHGADSLLLIGLDVVSSGHSGIFVWDGGSLYEFSDSCREGPSVFALGSFQDTLYAIAGCGFVFYNGKHWERIESDFLNALTTRSIHKFIELNNEFYLLGSFGGYGSTPAFKILKREGNDWAPFDTTRWYGAYMGALVEFKGKLYATGYVENLDGSIIYFAMFDGQKWHPIDNNIFSTGWVGPMVVYKDELWIAGYFARAWGQPGDKLARWDGDQWLEPHAGLGNFEVISGMFVHDDKLYVYGLFENFAGLPIHNLAIWDGEKWCGHDMQETNPRYGISTMTIFQDTFYIGGGFSLIDGDTIKYIAKWTGKDLAKYCTEPLSVPPLEEENNGIDIYPNPTNGLININIGERTGTEYYLHDLAGKLLQQGQLQGGIVNELNISSYSKGMYILLIKTEIDVISKKIIKN